MQTPYEYQGHIFGHYDSRGGATFVVAPDEATARRIYVEMGDGLEQTLKNAAEWKDDGHEFWGELWELRNNPEAAIKFITDEDYISAATLRSYRPVEEGEDLEWGDGTPNEKAQAFDEGLQWAGEDIEMTTANPYRETLWWHEESATLLLGEPGFNPGDPETPMGMTVFPPRRHVEGWRRSNFGEDACGLVFYTPKPIIHSKCGEVM